MRPLLALITPALALLAASCAVAPRSDGLTTAEAVQAQRIEFRLANAANRIRDDAMDAYLMRCLSDLDAHPSSPVTIYVFDDPTPQADLLANRILRLRLGLLLALRSEDELLFVLAHELAHRDLAHLSARRATDWDADSAEREADRAAVETLRGLGRQESAALALLRRVSASSDDSAYRSVLNARIESLSRIVIDDPPLPRSEWPLDAILIPYRDRAEP